MYEGVQGKILGDGDDDVGVQMAKRDTIRVKVNLPIRGFVVGQEVDVAIDRKKIPLDPVWRRRLRDAKTDNCCEIVKTRLAKKPARSATESKSKE